MALPGVLLKLPPPPVRARRDLSASAFARAQQRHGFAHAGGLNFFDTTSSRREYVVAVHRVDPIRISRRATLAKLLRTRNDTQ